MAAGITSKITDHIRSVLESAGVAVEDVDEVLLAGGGTRMPKVSPDSPHSALFKWKPPSVTTAAAIKTSILLLLLLLSI